MRLAGDTAADIETRLIDGWRRMTPAQKADIVSSLTVAAFDLARAGVRLRHPKASPQEQHLRLAIVVLGRELACRVYPDAVSLDP